MRRITLIFSVLLILFSLTVFMTAPASAVERRCDATYEWQTTGGTIGPIRFGEFTARGECGTTVPNRCRIRAREAAQRCIGTQWERRWQHHRFNPDGTLNVAFDPNPPEACLEAANIENYDLTTICTKPLHNRQDICFEVLDTSLNPQNIPLNSRGDIKTALEAEVCCKYEQGQRQFPDNENVRVRLSARTSSSSGNENCRGNQNLSSDYKIDCNRVRESVCRF